jgi:hypothetical protein
MAHIERYEKGLYQNIDGDFDVKIFSSIVDYFKEGYNVNI